MKHLLRFLCLLATLHHSAAIASDETVSTDNYIPDITTDTNPKLTPAEKLWLDAHPVVLLGGGPDWAPFDFVNKDGQYSGIANDYLSLIAKKTGLNFKIEIDQWENQLKKIQDKKIDLLGAAYYLEKREQFVNYSSPYFEVLDYFFIRDDLNVETLEDLNGKRVAIPRKFAHGDLLKQNFPEINIIPVDNFYAAIDAVLENRADMLFNTYAAVSHVLKREGISTIVPFKSTRKLGTNSIHIVTRKEAPELTSIVQKGLDAISTQEKQAIYNRWLGNKPTPNEQKADLTEVEKQWLKDHPLIQFGADKNWPPYEFIDKNGQFQGISADILNLIQQRLGIQFEIIYSHSWAQTLEKARNYDIDALSSISKTSKREHYLNFTEPYFTPLIAIYTRRDQPEITHLTELNKKTVVIENQYFLHEKLQKEYPEINLLPVKTTLDALKMLSYGQADAYVGNQGAANWIAEKNGINNLKITPEIEMDEAPLHIATRKDWPLFQGILNKALASISSAETSAIRRKWLGVDSRTNKFVLSSAEKQWLQRHKTIRFTGDPNWLPYEAFDSQGNYIGIVAEHLKLIEQKLGIKLDIIPTMSWSDSVAKVKRGEIDILSETNDSDLKSRLTFTQPYITSPVVIVMRSDEEYVESINQIKQKKIAVIKDYGYVPEIIKNYPHLNLFNVNSIHEGLTSVSTGEIDALLATLAQASYHISELGINNIRIIGKTEFNTKLAFGMQAEFTPLIPLFNRAIADISQNEKQYILDKWGKQKFAAITDYALLVKIAAVLLLIITIIVYWNRKLSKEITLRKEAEAQTQALIDSIPLQIIITSPEGNILAANPQALNDYKIQEDEIRNLNISDFYNDINDRDMIIRELLSRGKVDQKIVPFKKTGGEIKSMMVSIMPINYNNNKAFLTIAVDMTERLQLETALHDAKETAEAASYFKSQFLANMSHEIRTPMNAIIGMSHLALNTDLDNKQQDYIEKIKASGQNLLTVINDILDFSKIEAGKLEIESTGFLLDTLLDNMVSMIALQAEEKNLEIHLKRDLNIPNALIGDSLRISQILLNLIQNAIKFTDSGEIIISVQLQKRRRNTLYLDFSVSDTGIGIEEENINSLFDAFIQADSSTTRRYGGTGLGLSISQQLVSLMGSKLKAKSEISKGSTFSFTLRLTAQQDSLQQTSEPIIALRDLRILLIDNNPTSQQALVEILSSFSMDVSTATSAEQIYSLLEKADKKEQGQTQGFDLVLVDTSDASNINIASHIKSNMSLQNQPFVLLIATYAQEDISAQVNKHGLDGFLIKPTTPSTLFETINELFHRSENRQIKIKPVIHNFSGKALLVEDNSINQQVAKEMLENLGLLVVVVSNGEKAIQLIQQSTYDVVFMDVQMPGIDGFETTRRIRKKSHNSHLPIIAMTAHAMAGDKERCLDAGMNAYLSKPIDPEALYRSLIPWVKAADDEQIVAEKTLHKEDPINWNIDFPGINLRHGLSRIDNNAKLFLRLLQDFLDKYSDAPQNLNRYLKNNNQEEAQRLMHTLSGVAGTIGAESLQKKVLDIIGLLRDKTVVEENMLVDFRNAFTDTTTNLETWLNRENVSVAITTNLNITQEVVLDETVLNHIISLLEQGKPEAHKILAQVNLQQQNIENIKLISLALEYAQRYDFSSALSNLSKLKI